MHNFMNANGCDLCEQPIGERPLIVYDVISVKYYSSHDRFARS